jgi:hypothetical protein
VHSGEDLGASLRSVLGYRQESVKGKAIQVPPISSLASDSLSALLDLCGPSQARAAQMFVPSNAACAHCRERDMPLIVSGTMSGYDNLELP